MPASLTSIRQNHHRPPRRLTHLLAPIVSPPAPLLSQTKQLHALLERTFELHPGVWEESSRPRLASAPPSRLHLFAGSTATQPHEDSHAGCSGSAAPAGSSSATEASRASNGRRADETPEERLARKEAKRQRKAEKEARRAAAAAGGCSSEAKPHASGNGIAAGSADGKAQAAIGEEVAAGLRAEEKAAKRARKEAKRAAKAAAAAAGSTENIDE